MLQEQSKSFMLVSLVLGATKHIKTQFLYAQILQDLRWDACDDFSCPLF